LSQDIQSLLDDWEFDPDQLQVRVITSDAGQEKIQMRIDLGLVQMELSGRPDGTRPEGYESMLDLYEARAKRASDANKSFGLSADDCAQLMREGIQYYHRYLAAFHLERYELVARDTERNLRLFRFVGQHAARQRDKIEFDRYRPYVQMMHTRALASQSLKAGDHVAALAGIDDGIEAIRRFLREYEQDESGSECSELRFLLRWRREVEREQPIDLLAQLEQQLELSVVLEDYEEAARLRDQIRRLQETDSR
jgi:hypothetical protein